MRHVIDPKKLSQTFKLDYSHEEDYETGKKDLNSFNFNLAEPGRRECMMLSFSHSRPKSVTLKLEMPNGYLSFISFENITRVVYISKYRAIRLESHSKNAYSVLKIYWRGQFELQGNLLESIYPETVWAKTKDQ